ncbi:MAG: DUF885 domain-containing protein [Clostridiales Family XIII bacterium]|jgi:uncharacterized protein (DUF885 family)|nr:DUF885 domain-containing protein [Clostridiales Family XIII bacterium]
MFKSGVRLQGITRLALAVLLVCLLASTLAGCGRFGGSGSGDGIGYGTGNPPGPAQGAASGDPEAAAAALDAVGDAVFRYYISTDLITQNYYVAHPEDFGIDRVEPVWRFYGKETADEDRAMVKGWLSDLGAIDADLLDEERRLTYDILLDYFSDEISDEKYDVYGDVLSPTTGLQAQLPVVLAEFHFRVEQDFYDYIELLNGLPAYFQQIADYEAVKKEAGTFMAKKAAEDVIAQIDDFIAVPKNNLLIGVFDENVDAFEGLADDVREELKAENQKAVLESVVPAYKSLADSLRALNKDNERTGGLASLPDGKEYYKLLVRSDTGSNRSIEEMDAMLDQTIDGCWRAIDRARLANPDIYDTMEDPPLPAKEPVEILDYLKTAYDPYFPPLADGNYTVKHVDPSLEEFLSPAFYMVPAIDDTDNNVIYINDGSTSEDTLFQTLVHEGYPGHLYQTVYFSNLDRAPVRKLLDFNGYSEGWATYVENQAYRLAGIDGNAAEMFAAWELMDMCLGAKIDIGVNYYGWDEGDVRDFLGDMYMADDAELDMLFDTESIMGMMVSEPGNYQRYTMGCIEFISLREEAKAALGGSFDIVDFHRFILETGPAPFYIIRERMQEDLADGSFAAA